jgi:hypothetical protein
MVQQDVCPGRKRETFERKDTRKYMDEKRAEGSCESRDMTYTQHQLRTPVESISSSLEESAGSISCSQSSDPSSHGFCVSGIFDYSTSSSPC